MAPHVYASDIARHASAPEAVDVLAMFDRLRENDGRAPADAFLAALDPAIAADVEVLAPGRGCDWVYRRFGTGVAAAAGVDLTGRTTAALPGPVALIYRGFLDRIRRERRPLLAAARQLLAGNLQFWERLSFPCRTPEGDDCVLTFIRPGGTREDLLSALLEASRDGIMSLRAVRDDAGHIVDATILTANQQATAYSGHTTERLIDGSFLALFPGLVARGVWDGCVDVIETRRTQRFEVNISHRRLDTWLRATAVPLDDGFLLSLSDVTDLKYALIEAECSREELAAEIEQRLVLESELRRLTLTDELTGVANRRGFDQALRHELAMADRYGRAVSLVAIDLDHFKRINDEHGHGAGDAVLMVVAALFVEATRRDVDVVGRLGGEEFMILLPETRLDGAVLLAERIRLMLAAKPVAVGDAAIAVTASFGVREYERGVDGHGLLAAADEALYAAKRAGRNRVVASGAPGCADRRAALID
jgi:diguanylate cyclase (GGDEF)-like protein